MFHQMEEGKVFPVQCKLTLKQTCCLVVPFGLTMQFSSITDTTWVRQFGLRIESAVVCADQLDTKARGFRGVDLNREDWNEPSMAASGTVTSAFDWFGTFWILDPTLMER